MRLPAGFAGLLAAAIVATPCLAASPALPGCEVQLRRATMLIDRVAARDRAGPIANRARLCSTLRQNRSDMVTATGFLDRCLSGHARAENVAQMRASIADVSRVIGERCR